MTEDARDLCVRLLHKDPNQRLGSGPSDAEEIKSHPWFEQINWEKISNKTIAPPYKPQLDQADDTKHFLPEFTNLPASPTEGDGSLKQEGDQQFQGFSYDAGGNLNQQNVEFQMNNYE